MYTGVIEGGETVLECKKKTQVRWEYVLEPLDKATYWDHEPLPTEERRALSRRSLKVVEQNEKRSVKKEAGKNHEVRGGSLRGFSEGDNIRVVRPKLDVNLPNKVESNVQCDEENVAVSAKRAMVYGVKLTFDLPAGKSVGIMTVRACWHDIVFRNSLGFTETMFLY